MIASIMQGGQIENLLSSMNQSLNYAYNASYEAEKHAKMLTQVNEVVSKLSKSLETTYPNGNSQKENGFPNIGDTIGSVARQRGEQYSILY